ncbi:MAG: hypothetical protein AB7E72_13285 [Lysobacterales bacterium]
MRLAEARLLPRGLLLVPVSGGSGSGELQRALLLARSARQRWPGLPIAIAAAASALPAAADPGIDQVPLPGSPTRSSTEVIAAIRSRRPAVVIFDSTARPAQLRAARAVGAKVVYLSSRPSARARGFRFGALAQISEHWSVELSLDATLPGRYQRWLLRWYQGLRWRPLGTLHEAPDPQRLPPELRDFVDAHPGFALFCPGGGGGRIEGRPAGDAFAEAARALQSPAVVVRADWAASRTEHSDSVMRVGKLSNAALMALLQRAELAVVGAGSMLLQAVSLEVPCVAVALAKDQSPRLQSLAAHGAVLECAPKTEAVITAARQLSGDGSKRQALRTRSQTLGLRNGLEEALTALEELVSRPLVT